MFDFSPVAHQWLCLQGWYPERRVDPTPWLERLMQDGVILFPLLEEVLIRFGGLPVEPDDQIYELPSPDPIKSYRWFMMKDGLCTLDPFKGLYYPATVEKLQTLPWLVDRHLLIASIGKYDEFQSILLVSDGSLYYGDFYEGLGAKKYFALHRLGRTFAEGIHQLVIRHSLLS